MYFKIQVVIDAADPAQLADFWAFALDYVLEPPPHGFETWEEFGRSIGMPEEDFGDQAAVIDPADEGPRVYFQRVPEGKTGKNRVHLDLRTRDLDAEVERVLALGATLTSAEPVKEGGWTWHVLADPDGNEFCVLRPPSGYWASLAG